MIYLASHQNERVMVSTIAADYDIPKFYLAKLVQNLVKHQLIKASRGRTGGIALNKSAKNIRIIDIIHVIDGALLLKTKCVYLG